jgi:Domain of unknown function (DUF4232)
MTKSRLVALGVLGAAGLLLSACGVGATSASTSTSTSSSTSSTTTSSSTSTTTTTLPPTGAENLFISPGTVDELIGAFEASRHIAASDVAGTEPGSIYYGYVPSTGTYWARAAFQPSNTAPLSVDVEMQDGGGDVIFARPPGGAWKPIVSVGVPFCTGLLHDPIPKSILAVWQLCQGSGAARSSTQRCATSQLSIKVGETQGAAGTDLFPLVFTNTGTTSCLLQGFPGVSYEGPTGSQVAAAAVRSGTTDGPVLSVAPGASAVANAVVAEVATVSCAHPISVVGFRVYPPNQYASLLVPTRLPVCPNASPDDLRIYAFGVRAVI